MSDNIKISDVAAWVGGFADERIKQLIQDDLQQPQSRVAAYFNWLCDPCKHGREDEDPLIEEFIRLASRRGAGNLSPPQIEQPEGPERHIGQNVRDKNRGR